jgi:hypothetical protein
MYKIEDLSSQELSIIAVAVDYFLCNFENGNIDPNVLENLLIHLDSVAEAAEAVESSNHLIEKSDNLLVVDFGSKSN